MPFSPYPLLEPFMGAFKTADGFPMLAGGLCHIGSREKCLQSLSKLNDTIFGSYRDGIAIDFRLGQILREAAPLNTRFLAANISIPNVAQLCGGVAGDILCQDDSASGTIINLDNGVWGFALPGAGAALIIGSALEAKKLFETARTLLTSLPLTQRRILKFLELAGLSSEEFLFLTDGSGGSVGCMCIQSGKYRSTLWLPTLNTIPKRIT